MARTKEFDVDQVLDQAVELFWEKGDEATSMRELEQRLGIGRQSLYDTFGDKKHLFLRAMDRYTAQGRHRLLERLGGEDASLPALRAYFEDLVRSLTPRGERRGCMVATAILETGDADADVARRCRANEKDARQAFRRALERARAKGEIRADQDPGQAATYLVGQMYGLTVLARNGASHASLQAMMDHALRTSDSSTAPAWALRHGIVAPRSRNISRMSSGSVPRAIATSRSFWFGSGRSSEGTATRCGRGPARIVRSTRPASCGRGPRTDAAAHRRRGAET